MTAQDVLQLRFLELRARRGASAALAREAGVDPSTVSAWVSGDATPHLDKLDAIAVVLGLSVAELFLLPDQVLPLEKGRRHGSALARSSLFKALHQAFIDVALLATEHLEPAARAEVFNSFNTAIERDSRSQSKRRKIHRSPDSKFAHPQSTKTA
jgi:transcriptional regulator with XRE-family HTH domain